MGNGVLWATAITASNKKQIKSLCPIAWEREGFCGGVLPSLSGYLHINAESVKFIILSHFKNVYKFVKIFYELVAYTYNACTPFNVSS